MGTITRRADNAGKATFQVKIRRKGFPTLSQTFAEKLAAETWVQETEAVVTRGTFVDPSAARDTTLAPSAEGLRHRPLGPGCQFTGHEWQKFLREHNLVSSMSRRGDWSVRPVIAGTRPFPVFGLVC